MKSMKTLVFFASLIGPSLVIAAPVYLNCQTVYQGEQKDFSVKLDEETGKISHTGSDGSYNAEGFYGPNEIRYQYLVPAGGGAVVVYSYEIDRSSLAITETVTVKNTNPRYQIEPKSLDPSPGICDIVDVKDRKI